MDPGQDKGAAPPASARQLAIRFAAFTFLGMAAGAPATFAASALRFLPGATPFDLLFSTSFVVIGTTMLARILWAPIIDAHSAQLTGSRGRRRGWVALLLPALAGLSIAIGVLVPAPGAQPSPVYLGLMVVAMIVAGGLFAAVDGLRSAQPAKRTQGVLAVGQYAGTIVPAVVLALVASGGNLNTAQYGLAVTILWLSTGFLAAGWIGLWLLPDEEGEGGRVADLPRVQRLLASKVNLSAAGLRLTAWLYGVFICPIIDFFERHGRAAWLALLLLVLGNAAIQWGGLRMIFPLYPGTALATEMQSVATAATVLNTVGLVAGGILAFWLSPIRGFAVTLAVVAIALAAEIVAAMTAPALTPPVVAYLIFSFAGGAFFIAFVAVIGRLATPRFAAFQFSLLLIVALPRGVSQLLANAMRSAIGTVGALGLFLIITVIAIVLAILLARRLEPRMQPPD